MVLFGPGLSIFFEVPFENLCGETKASVVRFGLAVNIPWPGDGFESHAGV